MIGSAWALPLWVILLNAQPSLSGERVEATLLVKDSLVAPGQTATVEAKLIARGLLRNAALGGEPVDLLVGDTVVATAMTGGDGTAFLSYKPKGQGIKPVRVRVGESPRVTSVEGVANVLVWERRSPILAVEMTALFEEPSSHTVFPGLFSKAASEWKPMPEAAEELDKLTRFYYRPMYIVSSPSVGDGFEASAEVRDWLKAHRFPGGYVFVLPPGEDAMGKKIDEMHEAGWKSLKVGIGRSRAFAEAFVERRLDVVIVSEPSKGEMPRRAKVAKKWNEVRKKL